MKTIKMTMAQAIVRFLDNQYVSFDGVESKFVDGVATIFGHGIVLGLGQALDENLGTLNYYQGKNEQGMAHMAAAFAKQHNRRKIIAVASSIGPGAANMVTAAACATVNNIPLLLLPGDSFSTRQPDPVLQQIEIENNLTITTNDAFRPVCKYWDRVSRPEQVMSALINAMRVLTDPANTGAVCLALPQDVQGESFDYPESFFKKRVHRITRPSAVTEEIDDITDVISKAKKPLIICGGGVRYSEAGQTLIDFCEKHNIPFAETQAGKSAAVSSNAYNLGGVGVTGNLAANTIASKADCIIAVGSRLSDFTTSSKWLFGENVPMVSINASRFHAGKMDAVKAVGDAKATLNTLSVSLGDYKSGWTNEIADAKAAWEKEMNELANYRYSDNFKTIVKAQNETSIEDFVRDLGGTVTQTSALCAIREKIADDAIIVGASGSLPGDLQRMWTTDSTDSYHMEYGYSCMGYEIAGALGAKLACPDKEVYAMTGDGSFLMLHSELITAIQEKKKINILLFDNAGFGCINNLEMGNGVGNLGTEFRYRNDEGTALDAEFMNIDFAGFAKAAGAVGYKVHTYEELLEALEDSKKQTVCTLIDIKVLPKTMTEGYLSWWHTGIASVSNNEDVQKSYESKQQHLKDARKY